MPRRNHRRRRFPRQDEPEYVTVTYESLARNLVKRKLAGPQILDHSLRPSDMREMGVGAALSNLAESRTAGGAFSRNLRMKFRGDT